MIECVNLIVFSIAVANGTMRSKMRRTIKTKFIRMSYRQRPKKTYPLTLNNGVKNLADENVAKPERLLIQSTEASESPLDYSAKPNINCDVEEGEENNEGCILPVIFLIQF